MKTNKSQEEKWSRLQKIIAEAREQLGKEGFNLTFDLSNDINKEPKVKGIVDWNKLQIEQNKRLAEKQMERSIIEFELNNNIC